MNIEDFKPVAYSIEDIFTKQKEIKFLYEPSARELFSCYDIDTFEDQEAFKRYCWRITEELMEALEDQTNTNHLKEELIDGFNFMIELYLLYGWGPENLTPVKDIKLSDTPLKEKVLNVVYNLGITANILKNRQWRNSQYLVDLYIFENRFKKIWDTYFDILFGLGMSLEEIGKIWSLKYQVNLFRINSNY